METIINITCPTCGGKLEITPDNDLYKCVYCGNNFLIQRSGSGFSYSLVKERLSGIKIGVDKTASELAIKRLEQELLDLRNQKSVLKDSIVLPARFYFSIALGMPFIYLFLIADKRFSIVFALLLLLIGFIFIGYGIYIYYSKRGRFKSIQTKISHIDEGISGLFPLPFKQPWFEDWMNPFNDPSVYLFSTITRHG